MSIGLNDFLDLASLAKDIYNFREQRKLAKERQRLQNEELDRQKKITEARARREARIEKARLLAAQGNSGAVTSTVSTSTVALDSSLQSSLADLNQQAAIQREQFSLQASATKSQAAVDFLSGLGTFAASGAGKKGIDFTTNLFDKPTTAAKSGS